MRELFASGRIVQVILVLVLLEALVLVAFHRRTGRGVAPRALLWNLIAGGGLLLALYNALLGAPWPWMALWLGIAFAAHLADLWQRMRG